MHQVVGIVLVHLDLFKNDALLASDILGGEGGMKHQIRKNIEGGLGLLFEHLDVEADVLLAGERIEIAAHAVDFTGDLLGGTGGGALEDHMFDKVRDAVALGGFVARPAVDPDAHGQAIHMAHTFSKDQEAVREDGAAYVARGGADGSFFRAERFDRGSRSGHETP